MPKNMDEMESPRKPDRREQPKKGATPRLKRDIKAAEPKVIAVHKVQKNETWTHLALRYYGDMSEPYWRYMYEFNKELIGDNYKNFYAGLEIRVPELPDHMKKDKE